MLQNLIVFQFVMIVSAANLIDPNILDVILKIPQSQCKDQFIDVVTSLANQEQWAITMLDATAKLQSGILFGNVMHIGNYDQCLEISHKTKTNKIEGKYCTSIFAPHPQYGGIVMDMFENMIGNLTRIEGERHMIEEARLSYGFCVPKVCTAENLQIISNILEEKFQSPIHFRFVDDYCFAGDKPLDNWAIFGSVVFSFFGFLLIVGTIYDYYFAQKKKSLLSAFSFWSNGQKLLSVATSQDNLNFLNGLRVISMMWIVLVHGYQMTIYSPHTNSIQIWNSKNATSSSIFSGGSMAVDTFFTISGLLVVYTFMLHESEGLKISILKFYIHRILRLTPALAMLVLFTTSLISHMGTGPFWPIVSEMYQNPCKDNWWSTLLYLQNYIHPENQCIGQAWYLAVDTQMYLLSPLILFPLMKWPKKVITALVIFIILNSSYVFEITIKKNFGTIFINQDSHQYKYLYSPTHIRGTTYLIGMICGYLVFKTKTNSLKLNKWTVVFLWTVSLGIMIGIVLGHVPMSNDKYDALSSAFFNSFTRIGWSMALSVIIILCANGYGGVINSFLSWTVFNILIRLNYSIYLLHVNIIMMIIIQRRNAAYFDNLVGFHEFWGNYMFTVGGAVIWTLAFESPIIVLEKMIFNRGEKNIRNNDTISDTNSSNVMEKQKDIV